MKSKIILLGLNEINFKYVEYYINKGLLPNFKKIFEIQKPIETISEKDYSLLEPWIQWVTVYTGKPFKEHNVFRLGDITNNPKLSQIFEELESEGLSVGAVSPFNVENRLSNSYYFIPDPWTNTIPSGSFIIKALYRAIHHSVNNNAHSKFSMSSLISIGFGILLYVPVSRWIHYLSVILKSNWPGTKAVLLDSLLADVHFSLWKKFKPDFSHLFLNSGAHIQHHYLFNSKAYNGTLNNPHWYCPVNFDPLIKILLEYDYQIGKLLKLKNVKLLIATGLHQQPHKSLTFYWRLKEHAKFIQMIGITKFIEISPRMSRDFLILFNNATDALNAETILNSFYHSRDMIKIFKTDNRGNSLFVELIYPNDVDANDSIYSKVSNFELQNFKDYLAFVAIKNGEHNGVGYLSSNFELNLKNQINLTDVNPLIKKIALSNN